jgi:hypothetical protein
MPVFDVMNSGYILKTPADVFVSQKETFDQEGNSTGKIPWYEWANFGLIQFHPIDQAPLHPSKNEYPYAKFNNSWGIKTPKGYSIEIMQPVHRESVFTILPGVVDTDRYTAPINFPMVINDPDFQGLIPKGTPIAQIVPFKRESWQMEIGKESDLTELNNVTTEMQTKFFDRYKSMFRTIKEYK